MSYSCPLCCSAPTSLYHIDKHRVYNQCETCLLVFVIPPYLPSSREEKAEYQLHENDLTQQGYRAFLTRSVTALVNALSVSHQSFTHVIGLDFGCGPNPCFQQLCKEHELNCVSYDPFFVPNHNLIKGENLYDFISATEVIEHLHYPIDELTRLVKLLRLGGLLLIMTKRVESKQRFANWHYKNDRTHVCFYADETFQFIAKHYSLSLQIVSADIVILRKVHI